MRRPTTQNDERDSDSDRGEKNLLSKNKYLIETKSFENTSRFFESLHMLLQNWRLNLATHGPNLYCEAIA